MTALMLTPNKWEDFQHYKDRCPPWIKLHRDILNNRVYMRLPTASKALAPLFWLLASESKHKDGTFDASDEELEFRLRISIKEIQVGRKSLIDNGFFAIASGALADRQQVATPETEESRGETEADAFELFYQNYPKKVGKPAALKAWKTAKVKADELSVILADIATRSQGKDWTKDDGQFIPNPATYLNQRRWEDSQEIPSGKPSIFAGAI